MTGKVQVFRNGVSSGEVPIEVSKGIALRAFSIVAQHQSIAEVKGDSGKVRKVAKGSARVTGIVTDKGGKPLEGARVALQGGGSPTITGARGEYTLDSLPSGTQALDVRKLGYGVTDVRGRASRRTTPAKHDDHDVRLRPDAGHRRCASRRRRTRRSPAAVGYLGSARTPGIGSFLDGDRHQPSGVRRLFSDVMRMVTWACAWIQPSGDGRTSVITDSRSASNGCVNYYVDGMPWTTMTPGDIDNFVRPDEMVAVEVYHGSETPPQYSPPGQSGCASIVVWTVARVRPDNGSKKP